MYKNLLSAFVSKANPPAGGLVWPLLTHFIGLGVRLEGPDANGVLRPRGFHGTADHLRPESVSPAWCFVTEIRVRRKRPLSRGFDALSPYGMYDLVVGNAHGAEAPGKRPTLKGSYPGGESVQPFQG